MTYGYGQETGPSYVKSKNLFLFDLYLINSEPYCEATLFVMLLKFKLAYSCSSLVEMSRLWYIAL
jgi:hypothetical protein